MITNDFVGKIIEIKVIDELKEIYQPPLFQNVIGIITEVDIEEQHLYIKSFERNMDQIPYVSGPHRYCFSDITYRIINF